MTHPCKQLRTLLVAILCLVVITCVSAPIASAQPAVSAATDPADGYPLWYQDNTGIRVQPCLYTNGTGGVPDPFCVLLADGGFIPGGALVLGSNFPVEFFYAVADANPLTTPGCANPKIASGKLKWRGAVEGSFLTGVDTPGQQSSFTRTKIVATGLCPNTSYTFTHPYGTDTLITDALGGIAANRKIDIGCLTVPCDFTALLGSRVMGAFLQMSVVPPAAAGYLGDNLTLGTITGSPLGTNFFSVVGPGVNLTTNQFTVSGKIAGPLMASPSKIDFGGVPQFSTSAPAIPITFTNVFPTAITVTGTSFTGVNLADFAVFSDGCSGVPLARDATCVISVNFTPSLLGVESATLAVTHDGPFRSPLNISLTGTGIAAAAAPVVSLSAPSLTFPSTRVRMLSATQTITATNTIAGTAPLGATVTIINAPPDPITGILPPPAADQFKIFTDTCTGNFVPVGLTCQVSVQYAPTVATVPPGATAILNFADTALNTPQQVTLTGTGAGGIAAVSATTAIIGGVVTTYPDWYQDENGVQVQPCLYDPTNTTPDPLCILIPDGGATVSPAFSTALPLAFTNFANWPVEFFYFVADTKMDTPGCTGLTGPGKLTYRVALEGSLAVTNLKANPTMFTRTQITVSPGGLCPLTTYAMVTPYGTDLVTTAADGGVVKNKKGATIDTGCLGGCVGAATALPLSSRVFGGFLKFDPAVLPAAPAGYLGDAGFVLGVGVGTPHPVIGSPYVVPGEAAPANFFRIADAATGATLNGCGVLGPCQTNLFTVSGKLAQSVHTSQVGAPGPVTFAPTTIGTASAPQTVTITNGDVNPVTMGSASILIAPGGLVPSPDFGLGAVPVDTCSLATLAPAATCTINVVFNPTTVAGLLGGVLVITHGGLTDLDSPAEVPLSGIALPAITATTTTIAAPTVTFPANGSITVTVSPVAPAIATPTGSVNLFVDGSLTPITQALLGGSTTFILVSPAVGTHTLSATYIADPTFVTSTGTGSLLVNPTPAATTTAISAPAITYNANGSVAVTVSSAGGTPTGSVSLTVDANAPITQALVAGSTTFTLISPAAANHTLSASYTPDTLVFGASSGTGNLLVNPAATAMAITAPTITFGNPGLVTVAVSSAAGTPTGNVSLSVDGGAPIIRALVAGSTTFTLVNPAAGSHSLSATYAAQGNFAGSGAISTLVVNPATETIKATATASRNKLLINWTINGSTNILTPHTMTVKLTRTGEQIGLPATTQRNGSWKVVAKNTTIVPVLGDTITVTSNFAAGSTATFTVIIK